MAEQPYSREAFDAVRAAATARERTDGRWLMAASVGLGVAQLALVRWADGALAHRRAVTVEGVVFLLYMALVGWLFWRFQSRKRAAFPRCPGCGAVLEGLSLRIAVASGRCDSCGAQVVA